MLFRVLNRFGLGGLAALLLELHLPVVHPHDVAESHREKDHQDLDKDTGDDRSQEESPDVPHSDLAHDLFGDIPGAMGKEMEQVIAQQEHDVADIEPLDHLFLPEQELRDEQVVVQAIENEQRENHPGAVTEKEQRLLRMAGHRPGDEGRNKKNTSPDDNLGGVQDEISASEILHIANIVNYCIIIEPMLSAVVVLFSWSSFWMVREARLAE